MGQQGEITYNWRHETDIRGFGGQGASNSFQTAENVRNRVDSVQGKWQIGGGHFLNEAYVSYQRYRWNPMPANPDVIGENFEGLLRIGGRDTEQRIVQQRVSVRDDYARFLKWGGNHTAKAGGVVSLVDYDVQKRLNGNPLFTIVATSAGTSRRARTTARATPTSAPGTISSDCSRRTTGQSVPG